MHCNEDGLPPAPLPRPRPPKELASGEHAYYHEHLLQFPQEHFPCTSINLTSLQSQNSFNVIPPTSRATNYVVLRSYDVKGDPEGFKTGVIDENRCHHMVVFQYGPIVLLNVSDHEADMYLKIVEKHASGLLPEMRKDASTSRASRPRIPPMSSHPRRVPPTTSSSDAMMFMETQG